MGGESGRGRGRRRGNGGARNSGSGPGSASRSEKLVVSGCKDAVVGPIIRGNYTLQSENHDRPVYKKDEKAGAKGLDVMLYFWDDRDSPDFSGWWFGPQIGGDEVWAFHPDIAAKNPPPSGWQCPFDGPVDRTIQIDSRPATSSTPAPAPAPATQAPALTGAAAQQEEARRKKEVDLMTEHEEISKQLQAIREAEQTQKQLVLDKQREAEQEQKRKDHHSQLMLKKVLSRLRLAKPDTLKDLLSELDQVLASHCNSLPKAMRQEAEKVRQDAQARAQKISQFLQKADEKKKADEKSRTEKKEASQRLFDQLEQLVEGVETMTENLASKESSLQDLPTEEQLEKFTESVTEVDKEVQTAHQACVDFVRENRTVMEQAVDGPIQWGKKNVDALEMRADVCLQKRAYALQAAENAKQAALQRKEDAKMALERKAIATKHTERERQVFKRYDADGDEVLTHSEAILYAKKEFGFDDAKDVVERLHEKLKKRPATEAASAKGIPFTAFQNFKVAIGIAREIARDKIRLVAKKEHLAALEAEVAEVETLIGKAEASSSTAKGAAVKLDSLSEDTRPLAEQAASISEVSAAVEAADQEQQMARRRAEAIAGSNDRDIVEERRAASAELMARLAKPMQMIAEARVAVLKWEKKIEARRTTEVQGISEQARVALRAASPKAQGTGSQLLDGLGELDGDPLPWIAIIDFLRGRWQEPIPSDDEVIGWLDFITEGSEKTDVVAREVIWLLMQVRFKVVKQTGMTDALSTRDAKTLRMLEVDETLELIGEDKTLKDEAAGLERIRARASKDGLEGWVTVASNVGSPCLEKCRDQLQVLRERRPV